MTRTLTTEQLKEIMCVYGNTHPCYLAAAECLANREAQPVAVTDEMALAFHRALNDGGIGESDLEEIKAGLRGALCNITAPPQREARPDDKPFGYYSKETAAILERRGFAPISANPLVDHSIPLYTTPPAPAVPHVTAIPEAATLTNINQLCPLDSNLSQTDFATGWNDCRQYALTHGGLPPVIKGIHAAAEGWSACRAAMLTEAKCECSSIDYCGDCLRKMSVQPVSQVPDGWVMVPFEPTRQMMSQGHFAMGGTDRGKFRRIYQAMVAAAPGKRQAAITLAKRAIWRAGFKVEGDEPS